MLEDAETTLKKKAAAGCTLLRDHMPAKKLQNKNANGSLSPGIIDLTGLLNVNSLYPHAYCKYYWLYTAKKILFSSVFLSCFRVQICEHSEIKILLLKSKMT